MSVGNESLTSRTAPLLHYSANPHGATKLKPFGRVGPDAPLT